MGICRCVGYVWGQYWVLVDRSTGPSEIARRRLPTSQHRYRNHKRVRTERDLAPRALGQEAAVLPQPLQRRRRRRALASRCLLHRHLEASPAGRRRLLDWSIGGSVGRSRGQSVGRPGTAHIPTHTYGHGRVGTASSSRPKADSEINPPALTLQGATDGATNACTPPRAHAAATAAAVHWKRMLLGFGLGGYVCAGLLAVRLLALVEAGCLAAAGFCFEDGVKETVSPRSAARSPCCNPESACQPIGLWGSVCTAQPLSVRWERKPLGPLDRTATLRQARARLRCLADSSSLFRHGR